jgi:hypothetical protein
LNQKIRETGNIQCLPTEKKKIYNIFFTLWTDTNYEEREWISSTYNDDMITLDEIKTVLNKLKNGKAPGEDNINAELYKYA